MQYYKYLLLQQKIKQREKFDNQNKSLSKVDIEKYVSVINGFHSVARKKTLLK